MAVLNMAAPSSDHDTPPRVFLLDGAALLESRRRLRAGRDFTWLWVKLAGWRLHTAQKLAFTWWVYSVESACGCGIFKFRQECAAHFQKEGDFAIRLPSCGANIPMP